MPTIADEILKKATLPSQDWMSFLVCQEKPIGGERTLALLGDLYRITVRLEQGETRAWDEAMAGHWDAAIRGSSALQASLARALMCDVAVLAGDSVAVLLWDCGHFP